MDADENRSENRFATLLAQVQAYARDHARQVGRASGLSDAQIADIIGPPEQPSVLAPFAEALDAAAKSQK